MQEPRNQGFRAIVLSPTRELASQTYREFLRLSEGRGFRIHMVDKFAKASKVFKKQSGLKFGESYIPSHERFISYSHIMCA